MDPYSPQEQDEPRFLSVLESELYHHLQKYVVPSASLQTNPACPTRQATYFLDLQVKTDTTSFAIEIDGAEFHPSVIRDKWRDTFLIAAGHAKNIYRVSGHAAYHFPYSVLEAVCHFEPGAFRDVAPGNFAKLASLEREEATEGAARRSPLATIRLHGRDRLGSIEIASDGFGGESSLTTDHGREWWAAPYYLTYPYHGRSFEDVDDIWLLMRALHEPEQVVAAIDAGTFSPAALPSLKEAIQKRKEIVTARIKRIMDTSPDEISLNAFDHLIDPTRTR